MFIIHDYCSLLAAEEDHCSKNTQSHVIIIIIGRSSTFLTVKIGLQQPRQNDGIDTIRTASMMMNVKGLATVRPSHHFGVGLSTFRNEAVQQKGKIEGAVGGGGLVVGSMIIARRILARSW